MSPYQKQPKRYRRAGVRRRGPGQRKLGATSWNAKFDKVDTAKLISDIAAGAPVTIACAAVGVNPKSFYQWLDERPDFAQALAAEKQRVILESLAAIRAGSKDRDWRGEGFFLERVYRDFFAAPVPGVALGIQQNFTITYEKAQQLEQMRAQLLPEINAKLGLTNGEANGSEST
jgi:hypothetical protein